ncbi:MAG: molybdenum cofactor biosynthesis protein MoaB [Deltaproteobacteria bacterium]|nr:molybdenum cofactor biosynthesis protein MoaB [Deltaproteobacteria bacterium]
MAHTHSKSTEEHRHHAAKKGPVTLAIVTVSDTRTPETDESGRLLRERAELAGHMVAAYEIVPDDPATVRELLDRLAAGPAQLVLFNGGTGLSKRDSTYEALAERLEKTLPGFGELFRMLSYEQVGAAAMLSRAVAGVYRGKVVVCTPGSPAAVSLAWEKLLEPELAHLAWEVAR